MNRLEAITRATRERGRKALVPFFTAGFPDESTSLELLVAAAELGCPVVEVGVPFSDPVADGPIIQRASQLALEQGMNLRRALDLVAEISSGPAAPVLMTYLNPVLRMGVREFCAAAAKVGCAGVIIPDLGFEETRLLRGAVSDEGLALVDLVAPTTPLDRLARIAGPAAGFLYLVAVTGVTGTSDAPAADLSRFAGQVRQSTDLPLYAGFGIDGPDKALDAVRNCDGVIMGSALLRCLLENPDPRSGVEQSLALLRSAYRALEHASGGNPK
jgi:tryptophan synthase alpha chain